jgi:hypothetical protein
MFPVTPFLLLKYIGETCPFFRIACDAGLRLRVCSEVQIKCFCAHYQDLMLESCSGCVPEVHVHVGHVPSTALPGDGYLFVMKISDLPVKFFN